MAVIRPVFVCLNSTYRRACRYRGVCWRACSTKYSANTTIRRSFPTRPRKKRFESPPPGTRYRPRFVYSPITIPTCLNSSGGSMRDGGARSPPQVPRRRSPHPLPRKRTSKVLSNVGENKSSDRKLICAFWYSRKRLCMTLDRMHQYRIASG